jgi:hypothetical protein
MFQVLEDLPAKILFVKVAMVDSRWISFWSSWGQDEGEDDDCKLVSIH